MPAVVTLLLGSPLAERYRLNVIPTYRDRRPVRRLLRFAASLVMLVRWCAGPGPRIVHVHMAARGSMYRKAAVIAVAKTMRRPVVLQVHAGSGDLEEFLGRLGPARRRVLRAVFAASDRVLSVSASSAETLRLMITDADIVVVPNPPPPILARSRERSSESGGNPGQVTILYLGGFANPVKGGAVLLAALPGLLDRCPNANIVLAGPGEPSGTLPQRARWRGWLDVAAKETALSDADVFVMPSTSEGMPVALLEAMAHGLPIVVSRVGGIPEILSDGVDAILVEPGDPELLTAALSRLVQDPELRRKLGEAAARRGQRLADEDVYGKLDRIYASLTS